MIYQLSKDLPNKRAFVTGAASGFGRAFSEELAKDGWTVGISDLNEKGLEETKLLVEQRGGKAIPMRFDVADPEDYKAKFDEFIQKTGGIDLIINNAGVGDGCPFEEYPLEHWDWMLNINLRGVVYGCHYSVPLMKQQGAGHIINVASAAAFASGPGMSAYNVAKAGVRALSETLYAELKPLGIGVTVLMPTFVRTGIMDHAKHEDEFARKFVNKMMDKAPINADDVARITLKKAGRKSPYVVIPRDAKLVFFMKRYFPKLYLNLSARTAATLERKRRQKAGK